MYPTPSNSTNPFRQTLYEMNQAFAALNQAIDTKKKLDQDLAEHTQKIEALLSLSNTNPKLREQLYILQRHSLWIREGTEQTAQLEEDLRKINALRLQINKIQ